MKKLMAIFTTFVLLLVMSACDNNITQTSSGESSTITESEAENKQSYDKEDGTHVVINNDDRVKFAIFADSHIGQRTIFNRKLERAITYVNENEDFDFTLFLGDNIDDGYYKDNETSPSQLATLNKIANNFNTPYYMLAGNHDANTPQFEHKMIIECGEVAVIGFFANYYMFDPEDIYTSNGRVDAEMLQWLEGAFEKCRGKRIILACHYSIVEGENFSAPIPHAQPVPKRNLDYVDFGREKILELAEKYNAELYFNGHEHQTDLPVGTAGVLTDFSLGSLGNHGLFAEVTVDKNKAVVELKDANNTDKTLKKVEYAFKNK